MTAVTKSKKVRVATVRFEEPWTFENAPSPREQKRQRVAFLERAKADKERDGFVCHIVGSGSYQSLVVYRVEQIEGHAQTRGICQGCGGSVAVDAEQHTSLHGYERPGFGSVVGQCRGARRPAANFDLTLANSLIVDLYAIAAGLRAGAAQRDATMLAEAKQVAAQAYAAYTAVEYNVLDAHRLRLREAWLAASKTAGALEAESGTDRFRARQHDDYAKHLEATALPAFGTPLTELVVAA